LALPAHIESTSVWRDICAELRRLVGDSTFDIWLAPLEAASWNGTTLLVAAPPEIEAWVSKRFGHLIEAAAHAVAGDSVLVSIAGTTSSTPHRVGSHRGSHTGSRTADRDSGNALQSASPSRLATSFHPRYRFEQFIIGDNNRLAHAAALTVAENPGQAYNPLFVHAPPGLGKTHLLHAIGNYLLAFGGGASVRYATVEDFTNHFLTALTTRSVDSFKRAYRDADVLLIDDVQFLASKAKTEEEFFHTFNSLYETGRQLVLTCDRLPQQLVAVEQRLRERFESGLVADIAPPDFATRVAILRKRAALDHIELADPAVLDLIAERVVENIRVLEGALIKVVAHHSLTRRPIDVQFTTGVLDAIRPQLPGGHISIGTIQAAVADYYEIAVSDLSSASRAARFSWPRQVAIHLARDLTHASLQQIGEAFGGRNHATVLHACKRVSRQIATDPDVTHDLDHISQILHQGNVDRRH
jgi:chromosomal replication initiator protein